MSETSNKTRLEHDCIGQMEVPANVYWGIHTQRAIGNFPVSGITDKPTSRADSRLCHGQARLRHRQ